MVVESTMPPATPDDPSMPSVPTLASIGTDGIDGSSGVAGAIVDSMVKDLITPIIGLLGSQPDFSAVKLGPVGIGSFVNAVIAFLLKAAGLYFLIVLPFNKLASRMVAAAAPNPQVVLLGEIRDLLKQKPG